MINSHQEKHIIAKCRDIWRCSGGGKVLLAVSGGADSMAMLSAFKIAEIPIEVVHCNFNLRGDESIRDRDFVKNICARFDVPLHICEFDTFREAKKAESLEMTCRRLRYDFFRKLKMEGNFGRIAVAHNSDDNIETFFLNFLRGCGSRGLKGMETDTGEIIRPLLQFSRKEIISFLNCHSIPFITDSTNLESDYRRNFLRNEIFPLLESRWNGFRKAVSTTIAIQNRENAIIEKTINDILEPLDKLLPWESIENFVDPETLILYFIRPYGGTPLTANEMARSIESKVSGKKWKLGKFYLGIFTRLGILIETDENLISPRDVNKIECSWTSLDPTPKLLAKIRHATLSEIYLPFNEDHYEWCYPNKDMKIKSFGMQGSQNVLKVLKDAGIPVLHRKRFAILTDKATGEPIWLPGIKRSRLHLITPSTPVIHHCTLSHNFW